MPIRDPRRAARRHRAPWAAAVVLTSALLLTGGAVVAGTDDDPAPEPPAVTGWWRTDLGAVPLGPAAADTTAGAALARQWTHFGQGQEADYGHPEVVSAAARGLPAPPGGEDHVLELRHPPGDPASHRKLYKIFSARSWPSGAEPFSQGDGSPADVSARYVVYEYISSEHLRLSPQGWVNIAQLKEGYATSDGEQTSDPSWWLVLYDRAGRRTLDLAHWNEGRIAGPTIDPAPYLDRWVKIEFRLYQHDRLEVYLDQLRIAPTRAGVTVPSSTDVACYRPDVSMP